jgi:ankyrin repeat protein
MQVGELLTGATMISHPKLAHWALTLALANLIRELKRGMSVDGLLLAAASAHDPDPRVQEAVIRLLLRRGADVNETDKNGVSPLHRAVRFRSPSAVKLLLEKGADVNAVDRRTGSTPLHRAVTHTGAPATAGKSEQIVEIIRLLLAHGADRTIKNKAGKTAREYVRMPEILALVSGP